jgi:predicted GNAT family acetyltransferase
LQEILDNPVWHSLVDRHAALAVRNGDAARYRPDISVLAAVAESSPKALAELAELMRPGEVAVGFHFGARAVPGWRAGDPMPLVQMTCEVALPPPALEPTPLSSADVDDMLRLVELTQPGPFLRGTIEMGRYVGVWENGRLAGMAGERMKPPGYTEVSAVCSDPAFQGRGLGESLVRAVAGRIQAEGLTPFLHVLETNRRAIALYERLGFRQRITRMLVPFLRV